MRISGRDASECDVLNTNASHPEQGTSVPSLIVPELQVILPQLDETSQANTHTNSANVVHSQFEGCSHFTLRKSVQLDESVTQASVQSDTKCFCWLLLLEHC